MISCLEKVSMEERHEEITRNDYNINNPYSSLHKNALAGDDTKGKGTGHPGHGFWLPDCSGVLGAINYSNFDTHISSEAGNVDDRRARTTALVRSLYSADNQYSAQAITTNKNVMDGQYVMK